MTLIDAGGEERISLQIQHLAIAVGGHAHIAHQHDGKPLISGFRTVAHSDRVCRADFRPKTIQFRAGRDDDGNQLISVTALPAHANDKTGRTAKCGFRCSAFVPLSVKSVQIFSSGLIGRRLQPPIDVAADRLAIHPRLPGNRGHAQALPVQIQDHDEFPKPDHPCSPPDRQGKGGLMPGSTPQR